MPASSAASRKCARRYGDSASASIFAARDKRSCATCGSTNRASSLGECDISGLLKRVLRERNRGVRPASTERCTIDTSATSAERPVACGGSLRSGRYTGNSTQPNKIVPFRAKLRNRLQHNDFARERRFVPPLLGCERCSLNGIRTESAGSVPHHPPTSRGLRTPNPPRFSTCVYSMVVFTSRCPSNSCTVRMSAPDSSRWVAKECRNV